MVAAGLADAVRSAIFVLLGAALVLMAATLALVFNARLRLLPLALALAAAAHDLRRAVDRRRRPDDGVDRGAAGADRPGGGLRDPVPGALQRGGRGAGRAGAGRGGRARRAGPTILTAGLATATGFLVLLLSPVPMVRGFGALLVVGIVIALAVRAVRRLRGADALLAPGAPPRAGDRLGGLASSASTRACWRRANGSADRSWRALGVSLSRPRRVLAIGIAVAIVGLALDTQTGVSLGRPGARPAGPPRAA